jgi:hypothetical protein
VTDEKPTTVPDESDHLAYAAAMIRKSNVDAIVAGVQVAGPDAIDKALSLGLRDVQAHALIAIAERLDRVVGALEPRDSVEVVGDLDPATQDKINQMVGTMREAAERGAVPHTHMLADAFDLEVDGRVVGTHGEPARRRRTIVRDESAKVNFERGDHLEDVVGLLTLEVDELNRIYGAQVAPALDRLQGGTGDPEEFAPAVVGPLARKLDAIAKLCADRQVDATDGGQCDAREIWPSEILAILNGENPT